MFRLTKGGKLIKDIFAGATINTPSMLAVEDQLDALQWAESLGGLGGLIKRSQANLTAVETWVAESDWAEFLAKDPLTRSSTSICLTIKHEKFLGLNPDDQSAMVKSIVSVLASESAAFDVGAYRDAPVGFRIWGGGTVETQDIETLLPWLDWAFAEAIDQV